MDPNVNDEVFAMEADMDRAALAVDKKLKSHTASASSPLLEAVDERAPLLGNGISHDDGGEEPVEWFGTAEFKDLPWWKRPSIFWLLPFFLFFTTAYGGIFVPKLNLITDLICDGYYASLAPGSVGPMDPEDQFDRCRNEEIIARTTLFTLYGSLISGVLSIISSPKLGALSDRYGRKKLLVFTTSGVLLGEILTILVAKYPDTVDVNWILLGYAFDGLCGSFIVSMALSHSYATDCTPPQKRSVAFGYFHACLYSGIAIGPILAGYIIKRRTPIVGKTEAVLFIFYIALACQLLFILMLVVFIPESLSKKRQEAAREKHALEKERRGPSSDFINRLRSINLLEPLTILYPTGPGSSPALRRNLIFLASTDMIMFGVAMGAMNVITLYLRQQFNWQEWESSKYVSIVNTSRVLCLLVLLPLVTRLVRGRLGTSTQKNSGTDSFDLSLIRIAIFFDMLGYLGFSLARLGGLFTLSGVVTSIGGIGSPMLGSVLTKHVPPDRVGQLLGATGLLHAFARIVGPLVFHGVYYATVNKFRQAVFVCLAGTFGLAFLCSWFIRPHVYLEELEADGSPSRRQSEAEGDETAH